MGWATADVSCGKLQKRDAVMMERGVYGRGFFYEFGPNAAIDVSKSMFTLVTIDFGCKKVLLRLGKENVQFMITRNEGPPEIYVAPEQVFLGIEETLEVHMLLSSSLKTWYAPTDGKTFKLILTGLHSDYLPSSSTPILDRFLLGMSKKSSGNADAVPRVKPQRWVEAKSEYNGMDVGKLVVSGKRSADAVQVYQKLMENVKASVKFMSSKTAIEAKAKELKISYQKAAILSNEQILSFYRHLQKFRPQVSSHDYNRIVNNYRVLIAENRVGQKNTLVIWTNDAGERYTKVQIAFMEQNMEKCAKQSASHLIFSKTINGLSLGASLIGDDGESDDDDPNWNTDKEYRPSVAVMGRGITRTPTEEEILRVNGTPGENFSVENFIASLGKDVRHLKEWDANDLKDIEEIKEYNLFILQKLVDYNRAQMDQAILRDVLAQPLVPREKFPHETKWIYNVYLTDFKLHFVNEDTRAEIAKELEPYPAMLDERKKEIMSDISKTFGMFRLPKNYPCYVNMTKKAKVVYCDFEEGVIGEYDTNTGKTRIHLKSSSWKTVDIALPDFRVRFDKEAEQKVMSNEEFTAIRNEVQREHYWKVVGKEHKKLNIAAKLKLEEHRAALAKLSVEEYREKELAKKQEAKLKLFVNKRDSNDGSAPVAKRARKSAPTEESDAPADGE